MYAKTGVESFVANNTPEQTSLLKKVNDQFRAECMQLLKIEPKPQN
jgi:hypothetical protein